MRRQKPVQYIFIQVPASTYAENKVARAMGGWLEK
jgi:hypothetical protein